MNTPTSPTQIQYSTCPSCGSKAIAEMLTAKDYTVSHETFSIWECSDCQLRFTQNIPNADAIGKYYQAEEYISHSNTNKGLINRLYQMVRDYTLIQKRKLIRRVAGKQTGDILDIGCGTGEFLGTMLQSGWKTTGLEPDLGARKQAIDNFGLEVHESNHLFELAAGQQDVVTMWHVLEHVHRLHDYLDTIHQLLREDGRLIIAVPNYQSVDATHYQSDWAAYDVPRHLYHFSPNSMKQLLGNHGFELIQMKTMPFDAFYVSLLSEKYIHGKVRLVSAFWTGLRSYFAALGNPARCSSVMYIIRKTATS